MDAATIKPGIEIKVRDAYGRWHRRVARSSPFLNVDYVGRRFPPWTVVRVDAPSLGHDINWPLADVRLAEMEATR